MVGSTETPPATLKEGVQTIVIKLPFDLQERLLAFPFLHDTSERYPKAELHFITPKKEIEVLNLLPFKAYYHEFDEDEIQNVFDVHRFCMTAKIYHVDLFVSLTNSFADACLGIGFKAKQRLGFSDNWKTLVLNQKTLRPVNHHICEDYFSLMKVHLGHDFETKVRISSRQLPPIIEDWDSLPYVAVNLSPLRSAQIEPEWIDFVSRFENHRFVFFTSEDQERSQMVMDSFLAKLPKTNLYMNFLYKNWIDLAKMLAFARGVITYNGPIASYSAYTGNKTLIIYDREDPQRYGPFYFLGESIIIKIENTVSDGSLKSRAMIDMGHVADITHRFFKL